MHYKLIVYTGLVEGFTEIQKSTLGAYSDDCGESGSLHFMSFDNLHLQNLHVSSFCRII